MIKEKKLKKKEHEDFIAIKNLFYILFPKVGPYGKLDIMNILVYIKTFNYENFLLK